MGSYKFDNTNFAGGVHGTRYDLGRWPLDASYTVLRRFFWLATDSAYKGAVETISRKRAALRDLAESNPLDDFLHAQPIQYLHELSRLAIDEDDWAARVRAQSAIFAEYPGLLDSRVDLDAETGGYYVVNSEGTAVRTAENATLLRARAVSQAADGMLLHDAVTFLALDPAHLPGDTVMNAALREMARISRPWPRRPRARITMARCCLKGRPARRSSPNCWAAIWRSRANRWTRAAGSTRANSKAAWARACCPIPSMWWTIRRRRNGAAGRCSAPMTWIAKASARRR